MLPAQPLCRLGMPMCLGQRAMANLFRRRYRSCTEPYGPCGSIRLPHPFLHLGSDGNASTASKWHSSFKFLIDSTTLPLSPHHCSHTTDQHVDLDYTVCARERVHYSTRHLAEIL